MVYSINDKKKGKLAITKYKVINENNKYSLLDIEIKTGRKNQIRVQLKDNNTPILGDKKYGDKNCSYRRLMLHANYLLVKNPITKKMMEFTCNTPNCFDELFKEVK